MRRISRYRKQPKAAFSLALAVGLGLWVVGTSPCVAQSGASSPPWHQTPYRNAGKPSGFGAMTSSIKRGTDKFLGAITPKTPVKQADDPISLNSKGKPSAELYVAVAAMHEESGRLGMAAEQYDKALEHSPNYLGALLGYARLKDRLGELDEATQFYARAVQSHPSNASAHNNQALFYARHGKLSESVVALEWAIRLEPKNAKYRNNIATVLVQMGSNRRAFEQLSGVHSGAIAYYNLGYLLAKKGDARAAAVHYQMALRLDPKLAAAKHQLARLSSTRTPPGGPTGRPNASPRLTSRPRPPAAQAARPSPPAYRSPPPPSYPPPAPPTYRPPAPRVKPRTEIQPLPAPPRHPHPGSEQTGAARVAQRSPEPSAQIAAPRVSAPSAPPPKQPSPNRVPSAARKPSGVTKLRALPPETTGRQPTYLPPLTTHRPGTLPVHHPLPRFEN